MNSAGFWCSRIWEWLIASSGASPIFLSQSLRCSLSSVPEYEPPFVVGSEDANPHPFHVHVSLSGDSKYSLRPAFAPRSHPVVPRAGLLRSAPEDHRGAACVFPHPENRG